MIKLTDAKKIFDKRGIAGLHSLNLSFDGSKLFAIMGPSGSGKTTLLKAISKEIVLDSGVITGNDHVAYLNSTTMLDSSKTMHQTLFDAITVTEDEDKKIQLVRDMSMLFEMTGKLKTLVSELSAGQYQRVLLASFLINRPTVLLLDEPFSNLDETLRQELMIQLKALILEREIMVLWVTHQTGEALSFADHIVLLQHGSVEQQGSAQELFFKPKSIFAAQFFGHHNLYAIHHSNHTSTWVTPWGEHPLNIEEKRPEVVLVIPEESISLGDGPYEGRILSLQFLGALTKVELESSAQILVAKIPSRLALPLQRGQKISFNIKWLDCFDIGCL